MWRAQANPRILDPLMKMIDCGTLDARLQKFLFPIRMSYTDEYGIIFECLTSGEYPDWLQSPQRTIELNRNLCYVTLMPEARWRFPVMLQF